MLHNERDKVNIVTLKVRIIKVKMLINSMITITRMTMIGFPAKTIVEEMCSKYKGNGRHE